MSDLPKDVFQDLSKMSPEQRFEYALEKIYETQILWGLYGENGWVMLRADEDACFPVWPHKEFALAWKKADDPASEPKQIGFPQWLGTWLPGMKKNNTLVLVFPLADEEEGIMLDAQEMLDCIEEDLGTLPKPDIE
ncbi:DUF2750 domain-containing protein [Paraglaciecola marina]|uniref:DUF2750 domain-containing protein n=1 Tax=Paraglaciecola marina TaxID=2500157 RepID=UPI00105F4092|nr:DUF2750 domain-containing protein [Paraglaciecola marina]